MDANLEVIASDRTRIIADVVALVGDRNNPKPLTNDADKGTAAELVVLLKMVKNGIVDYFKPRKVEAKKPYEDMLEAEKAEIEKADRPIKFLDDFISQYNDKIREEQRIIRMRQAEEEASAERKRIEAQQESAISAGNDTVFQVLEEEKQAIIAEAPIKDVKVNMSTDFASQGEQEEIRDFVIVDHAEFAAALLETQNANLIVLDKKTETAFKKVLLMKPTMKAFPGVSFKRGFKNSYRGK